MAQDLRNKVDVLTLGTYLGRGGFSCPWERLRLPVEDKMALLPLRGHLAPPALCGWIPGTSAQVRVHPGDTDACGGQGGTCVMCTATGKGLVALWYLSLTGLGWNAGPVSCCWGRRPWERRLSYEKLQVSHLSGY